MQPLFAFHGKACACRSFCLGDMDQQSWVGCIACAGKCAQAGCKTAASGGENCRPGGKNCRVGSSSREQQQGWWPSKSQDAERGDAVRGFPSRYVDSKPGGIGKITSLRRVGDGPSACRKDRTQGACSSKEHKQDWASRACPSRGHRMLSRLCSLDRVASYAPVLPHLAPAGHTQQGQLAKARPSMASDSPLSAWTSFHMTSSPTRQGRPRPYPASPLGVPAVAARPKRRRRVDVCGHAAAPRGVHRHEGHLPHQVVVPLGQVAAGAGGEGGCGREWGWGGVGRAKEAVGFGGGVWGVGWGGMGVGGWGGWGEGALGRVRGTAGGSGREVAPAVGSQGAIPGGAWLAAKSGTAAGRGAGRPSCTAAAGVHSGGHAQRARPLLALTCQTAAGRRGLRHRAAWPGCSRPAAGGCVGRGAGWQRLLRARRISWQSACGVADQHAPSETLDSVACARCAVA